MNILIYPGTFDPIHGGHIDAVRGAMREKEYGKVYVLLQTNRFKDSTMFTYEARLQFIKDALIENGLSKVDIIRTDSQYLYDAMSVAGVFGEMISNGLEVDVLIGDDNLGSIEKWMYFDILNHRCRFLVVQRLMTERAIYVTGDRIFKRFSVILRPNKESSCITSTNIRHRLAESLKGWRESRTRILTRD